MLMLGLTIPYAPNNPSNNPVKKHQATVVSEWKWLSLWRNFALTNRSVFLLFCNSLTLCMHTFHGRVFNEIRTSTVSGLWKQILYAPTQAVMQPSPPQPPTNRVAPFYSIPLRNGEVLIRYDTKMCKPTDWLHDLERVSSTLGFWFILSFVWYFLSSVCVSLLVY